MSLHEFNKKSIEDYLFTDSIKTGFDFSPILAKNLDKLIGYSSQIDASFNAARHRIDADKGIARSAMPLSASHSKELEEYESSITKTVSKSTAKQPNFRGIESLSGSAVCNTGVKILNSENPYGLNDEQIENCQNGDDDLNNETIELVVNEKGNPIVKLIPIRKGFNDDCAFVDTIHFTFHKKIKKNSGFLNLNNDHDYAVNLSEHLQKIFGFAVTEKKEGGLHNYSNSYEIGNNWGRLCIGVYSHISELRSPFMLN